MKIRITRLTPEPVVVEVDVVDEGGLSQTFGLPGSPLTARAQLVPGAAWNVRATALPDPDVGEVVERVSRLGPGVLDFLFPPGGDARDRGYRAIWESDLPLPYRAGVLVLAFARRADEARQRRSR